MPRLQRIVHRTLVFLLIGVAVAACGPRTPPIVAPAAGFPPDFPVSFYSTVPRASVYRVVPERSSLALKVYRTGPLAALGHNHVIESHGVEGFIYTADDSAQSRADLFVAVASLVVDDAAARAAAGPDFATQPSAADIDGTRANMLGAKLLDAAQYPYLVVHVAPNRVEPQPAQVELSLQVHGRTSTVPVNAVWRRTGDELTIQANFSVTHAALGLEPFSAAGGMLRVADQIDIAVALVAKALR